MILRQTENTVQALRCGFFRASIVLAAATAGLASCTKDATELEINNRREIVASSILGEPEGIPTTNASNSTRSVVDGTTALTLYFARADETTSGSYGAYSSSALTATRQAGTGAQTLTFNPVQYHLLNGLKTKITGWYPGGATTSSGNGYYNGTTRTVSWTIDGQQDVMTAAASAGTALSAMPALTFKHRLSQLQFYPYAELQSTIDAWGKITKIEVLNQKNTVSYALTNDGSGALSFSGNATNAFSAGVATTGVAMSLAAATNTTGVTRMGNPVMLEPQSSSTYSLTLRITTANRTKTVSFDRALQPGTPYRLYLRFKPLDITIEASVVNDWVEVTTNDKLGDDGRVGALKDGGIVYWVDPADATKYKVFSLDEGSSLAWAAKTTYVLGAAGQSTTDGKGNVATMKAYSSAHTSDTNATTKTTGVFATDFPAAAFCDRKNTDGVTGWYLPATDELEAFYTAYRDNTTVLAGAITTNHGTAMSSDYFWSSTEHSLTTTNAWRVYFSNGLSNYFGAKGSNIYVRCVRAN